MRIRRIPYFPSDQVEWRLASEEERDAFIGRCVKGFFHGPVMAMAFLVGVTLAGWIGGMAGWWTLRLLGMPYAENYGGFELVGLLIFAAFVGLIVRLVSRLRGPVKRQP
jgi:hypothetical protein